MNANVAPVPDNASPAGSQTVNTQDNQDTQPTDPGQGEDSVPAPENETGSANPTKLVANQPPPQNDENLMSQSTNDTAPTGQR